jgi:hypothetical protein
MGQASRLAVLVAAGAALAIVFAGCGSPEPIDWPEEASLELGTGSWRFEPIEDGAEVNLVRGAQGGWHIWLSLRTAGVMANTVTLNLHTELPEAETTAHDVNSETPVSLDPPNADGERLLVGWPHILPDPGCFVGQTVVLTALVSDDAGHSLSDERTLVIGGGDDPPPPCE